LPPVAQILAALQGRPAKRGDSLSPPVFSALSGGVEAGYLDLRPPNLTAFAKLQGRPKSLIECGSRNPRRGISQGLWKHDR